jgi:hypothetical protein
MSATKDLDDTLRRYVLDDLAEERRLTLEERLVTDPRTFEALGIVEDEIAEAYLEGSLPNADRTRFERHLARHPERRRDLAFLRLMRRRASTFRTAASGLAALGWRPQVRARPGAALAMAASLVLVVGAAAWLAVGAWQTRGELQQLRTAVSSSEIRERNLRDANARLENDLRASAERERQLNARTASHSQSAAPAVGIVPPTFVLAAGLLRGEGGLARIAIPAGAPFVRLQLDLPASPHAVFRAVLYDADSRDVWMQSNLPARLVGKQKVLVVQIAADALVPGDYRIVASSVGRDDSAEPVATYPLRVARTRSPAQTAPAGVP